MVENGEIVSGTYAGCLGYRVVGAEGPTWLSTGLEKKLKEKLEEVDRIERAGTEESK